MCAQCQRCNDLIGFHFFISSILNNDLEKQFDNQNYFIMAVSSTDPEVIKMIDTICKYYIFSQRVHINVCSYSFCIHVSISLCL